MAHQRSHRALRVHAVLLRGNQHQSMAQNAFDPISWKPNYKPFAVKVEHAKGDEQR